MHSVSDKLVLCYGIHTPSEVFTDPGRCSAASAVTLCTVYVYFRLGNNCSAARLLTALGECSLSTPLSI